jgi:hypothetical protein
MFEPISARLASSCSRNGISAADTPTICRGRDVDVLDLASTARGPVALRLTGQHPSSRNACRLSSGVSAGEDRVHLLVGAQIDDFGSDLALLDDAVGRREEAVLVDRSRSRGSRSGRCSCLPASRSGRSGRSALMCTSRTSKPARLRFRPPGPRAESRRSWVSSLSGLVWSTTWLSSPRPKKKSMAEEIVLAVDQVPRRELVGVLEAHALLDGAAELQEALAELVAGEFVDRPQTPVAQMVDVVDLPVVAVAQRSGCT